MRADRTPGVDALVERGGEYCAIDEFLGASSSGTGGILIIEGVAGIGKTRLLRETGDRGSEAGAQVLRARGSELEQEFAFGVVRQLFEPLLRSASAERLAQILRGTGEMVSRALFGEPTSTALTGAGAVFAVFLGLYWAVANLCEDAPLLLLLDDVQWADNASQLFLAFLGGRLGGLRLGLAAALRSGGGLPPALVELAGLSTTVILRPASLSASGVAALAEQVLEAPAEPLFVDACLRATGGVPFYVRELLRELAREGIRPVAPDVPRIAEVLPTSVLRSVRARIARVSDDATTVARAIAVLGDHGTDEQLAALSYLDRESMSAILIGLVQEGVLAEGAPRFAHPIIQSSVYEDIPSRERAEMHRRAARLLHEGGYGVERVSTHLLRARPAGNARAVELLRDAAGKALARGGTTEAVALLRRALAEPPEADRHAQVLFELGCAEQRAGEIAPAVEHLGAAMEAGRAASWWGEAVLALAQALFLGGHVEQATRLVDRAGDMVEHHDPEMSLRLRLAFLLYGRVAVSPQLTIVLDRLPSLRSQVGTGDTPAARLLRGTLSAGSLMANEPAVAVGRMAREAWGGGELLAMEATDSFYYFPLVFALIGTGEHETARSAIRTLLFESRRRGSASGMAMARTMGSLSALRLGALLEAEADALAAVALARDHFVSGFPMALGLAVEALVERGELARAEELITGYPIPQDMIQPGFYEYYLAARGALHLAQHRWQPALDDLQLVGRRLLAWQAPSPAVIPWRSRAAAAADRLGDRIAARRLVWEEVELADAFGCPHTRAVALQAAGLIIRGPEGQALIEQAIESVDDGPYGLEAARANIALGRLLRHRGSLGPARARLRRGLDQAVRCRANPLVILAREELVAAGGRPRRWAVTGVESLTATERRICALARTGLSNRDIAQELFVVVKTVEVHLTASYRKLGISSRMELPDLAF